MAGDSGSRTGPPDPFGAGMVLGSGAGDGDRGGSGTGVPGHAPSLPTTAGPGGRLGAQGEFGSPNPVPDPIELDAEPIDGGGGMDPPNGPARPGNGDVGSGGPAGRAAPDGPSPFGMVSAVPVPGDWPPSAGAGGSPGADGSAGADAPRSATVGEPIAGAAPDPPLPGVP